MKCFKVVNSSYVLTFKGQGALGGTNDLFPEASDLGGFRRGDLLLTGANGLAEPFLHKAPESFREAIWHRKPA